MSEQEWDLGCRTAASMMAEKYSDHRNHYNDSCQSKLVLKQPSSLFPSDFPVIFSTLLYTHNPDPYYASLYQQLDLAYPRRSNRTTLLSMLPQSPPFPHERVQFLPADCPRVPNDQDQWLVSHMARSISSQPYPPCLSEGKACTATRAVQTALRRRKNIEAQIG